MPGSEERPNGRLFVTVFYTRAAAKRLTPQDQATRIAYDGLFPDDESKIRDPYTPPGLLHKQRTVKEDY